MESAKDYVRAIDVYRSILQLVPEDQKAMEGILALYRRDNRWAEVADILGRKVQGMAEGSERRQVEVELAGILEQYLDQADAAVELYVNVLRADEQNHAAVEGLERLLSRTTKILQVAEMLEPRYQAENNWARAADMTEIRVREEADPAHRIALLQGLAVIYEQRLSQPVEALAAMLRAFQADPTGADLVELERVAEAANAYSGVIRAYRAACLAVEGNEKYQLLMRAGALAEKQTDLRGAAVDFLKALAVATEGDRLALEGLARLLAAGLEAEKLATMAGEVAAKLEDEDRTNLWRRLAGFLESDLNSPLEAIRAWRFVLEDVPEDAHAKAELDRLYGASAEPKELVSYLREKMAAAEDEASRADLGFQIADVLAWRLKDFDAATTELRAVSELMPGERRVWQALTAIHKQAGAAGKAAQTMLREINLLAEGEERHQALVAYAEHLAKQVGDVDGAIRALQSVLTAAPADATALLLLEDLVPAQQEPEVRAQFVQMLADAYRAGDRHESLVALLSSQVEDIQDTDERVGTQVEIALLRADKLNDAEGALAHIIRAFHDAPLDPTIRSELERMAGMANAWEQLVEAYNAALAVVPDVEEQRPIRRRLAEVLDKRLGRGADAVEHYKAAGGGALPDDLESLEGNGALAAGAGPAFRIGGCDRCSLARDGRS